MKNQITTKKATYRIDVCDHWRMAGGMGQPMYREMVKEYNIYRDGIRVSFCYEEDQVEEQIKWLEWNEENPKTGIGSRFD